MNTVGTVSFGKACPRFGRLELTPHAGIDRVDRLEARGRSGTQPELGASAQQARDLGELDLAVEEQLDGDLVRGREPDHRTLIAGARGCEHELEAGIAIGLDVAEVQRARGRPVEAPGRRLLVVPEERVLDRQAHVGLGELRDHTAVDELDHRVDHALGMQHDVDTVIRRAIEPMRLDDLVALVRQGR